MNLVFLFSFLPLFWQGMVWHLLFKDAHPSKHRQYPMIFKHGYMHPTPPPWCQATFCPFEPHQFFTQAGMQLPSLVLISFPCGKGKTLAFSIIFLLEVFWFIWKSGPGVFFCLHFYLLSDRAMAWHLLIKRCTSIKSYAIPNGFFRYGSMQPRHHHGVMPHVCPLNHFNLSHRQACNYQT